MNMYHSFYSNPYFFSNYNLYCIDVDSANWSTIYWSSVDPWASFSNDCQLGVPGCTDSTNINYDPNATVNDGSCYYTKTYVTDNNSLRIKVKSEYPDSFGCSILALESTGNYLYPTCTSSSSSSSSSSGGAGVWDQSTWDNSVFGD